MLRKMRDSNPRYPKEGIPDFESSAFGHSANLPSSLSDAKVRLFLHLTKYRRFFLIKLYFHLRQYPTMFEGICLLRWQLWLQNLLQRFPDGKLGRQRHRLQRCQAGGCLPYPE